MKLEMYNEVIEEYVDNLQQILKELHQNLYLMLKDIDEIWQNAKE